VSIPWQKDTHDRPHAKLHMVRGITNTQHIYLNIICEGDVTIRKSGENTIEISTSHHFISAVTHISIVLFL